MKKKIAWVCDIDGWAFANQVISLAKHLNDYEHKLITLRFEAKDKQWVYKEKDKLMIEQADITVAMTPSILIYTNKVLKNDIFIKKSDNVITRLSGVRSI